MGGGGGKFVFISFEKKKIALGFGVKGFKN